MKPKIVFLSKFILIPFMLILFTNCKSIPLTKSNPLKTIPEYKPYETLLEVIGDFQLHLNDDIYRFPMPKDITGQNIFKSTILRIESYQALYPEKFRDITSFTKALAYEKLEQYKEAIKYYEETISYQSELKDIAQGKLDTIKEFDVIVNAEPQNNTIDDYIRTMENKTVELNKLIEKYKGTPYEFLALIKKEQNNTEYFHFLKLNRYYIDNGMEKSFEQIKKLTEENKDSKNIYKHKLRLADYYFELAKEYALFNNPEETTFNYDEFFKFIKSAKNIYDSIAYTDGIPEKLEARGRAMAIEAYDREIRELYR